MATLSMASPWRDPRTGMYYLRKRVPSRFVGVAGVPAGPIKWSLGTKDSAEARRLWPDALARWATQEAEWDRLKNTVEASPAADSHTIIQIRALRIFTMPTYPEYLIRSQIILDRLKINF